MNEENKEPEVYPIWIDWEKRIISFHEVKDFEKMQFSTHEAMFKFVIKKGSAGFAIQ